MADITLARELFEKQKYSDAVDVLDQLLLTNKKKDELWYLRGVASLKLKNYGVAHECFDRALSLNRKPGYYQIKGMAYFEVFDIDSAIEAFNNSLDLDSDNIMTSLFLAVCYLLADDPRADVQIRKSYKIDSKKTRQFLLNFYALFLKGDPRVSDAQKKKIELQIRGMK
jgi:tetratricopeptide (TPR) repeat protein